MVAACEEREKLLELAVLAHRHDGVGAAQRSLGAESSSPRLDSRWRLLSHVTPHLSIGDPQQPHHQIVNYTLHIRSEYAITTLVALWSRQLFALRSRMSSSLA